MTTGKCQYCGMPLNSGEKFCHSCGAANSHYKAEDEKPFNAQLEIVKEESKTAKFIITGMVIFCVVLCGTVFGIFAMTSGFFH